METFREIEFEQELQDEVMEDVVDEEEALKLKKFQMMK
jgi:hypothetical protein